MEEENIYSDGRDQMVRDDEISPEEEAFMKGYEEAEGEEDEDDFDEEDEDEKKEG